MTDFLEIDSPEEFKEDDDRDQEVIRLKQKAKLRRGRGFNSESKEWAPMQSFKGVHSADEGEMEAGPQRPVEGCILFVISTHEEAQEDDVQDLFFEYGEIKVCIWIWIAELLFPKDMH